MKHMTSIQMREWSETSFADNPMLADLSFGNDEHARRQADVLARAGMLEVVELRRGLAVRSTSYVGRIQLGDVQITVQPKIKLDVLLTLFRYAYSLRDLRVVSKTQLDIEQGAFQDVLIEQLIIETERLIARGIQRQYRQVAEALPLPKGRIDFQAIARQRGRNSAQIPVIHRPRLENTLANQVLLAGLCLAAPMTNDLAMRSHLRRLASMLEGTVSHIRLTPDAVWRVRREINRLTSHYESSMTLIELLLLSRGVTLEATSERVLLPGFLFDMNHFFERLLSRFLNESLAGYDVHDQYRLTSMMAYNPAFNPVRRQSPAPRPDFVIRQGKKLISIVDAKYRDLWENALPREMLYQLAVYALSQGWNGQSIILYPSIDVRPKPQMIDIRDALVSSNKASIILKPVDLQLLSRLVSERSLNARRKREQFAERLIFGV
jgi:5-methylcytosine-specific restriction enzyme subunit McrC